MTSTLPTMTNKPACVLLTGPQAAVNFDGDDVAEWRVCIADADSEPIDGNARCFRDYGDAVLYASRLARNGRFTLCDEAYPT